MAKIRSKSFASNLEKNLIDEIRKKKLLPEEVKRILGQLRKPEIVRKTFEHFHPIGKVRIGVVSDLHIGSKFFDYDAFEHSVQVFNKEKISAIYIPGDVIEGSSGREGHVFELEKIGTSEQIEHAVKLLKRYNKKIYFTTGNHDEWAKKKGNQGFLVGPEIERRVPNAKFLGEYTADVKLSPNVTMRLTHEGSASYALSYSIQKRINALSGGQKPNIILNGHIHKMLVLRYRNIYAVECGTLQRQTPFMQMIGTPAHVGFYVIEIEWDDKGVTSFTPKMFAHYE